MSRIAELIAKLCPNGIEYVKLEDVCTLVTGATPSKTNPEYWENGTVPWMSSGEVNNKVVYDTESKITQLGYDKTSTTLVPIHTVVIALAGQGKTRGKVAITEIELCTNQSLCSIICGDKINYKFLYHYLDSKYEELREISNGDGTRGGLSLRILKPYTISLPPLEIQIELVRILDEYSASVTALQQELEKELTARKKQYEYYRDLLLDFGIHGGQVSANGERLKRYLTFVMATHRPNQMQTIGKMELFRGFVWTILEKMVVFFQMLYNILLMRE